MLDHFQDEAQQKANDLFVHLDSRLKPQVYLIELPRQQVFSKDSLWTRPKVSDSFSNTLEKAGREASNGSIYNCTDPDLFDYLEDTVFKNRPKVAETVFNECEEFSEFVTYCSPLAIRDKKDFFVILQLPKTVTRSFCHLNKTYKSDMLGNYPPSLISSTANSFLRFLSKQIEIAVGDPSDFFKNRDSYLLEAGSDLMYLIGSTATDYGSRSLFAGCSALSLLKYEGEESRGTIFISQNKHPNIDCRITLSHPVPISNYKTVRKLLEMCFNRLCLLSNSETIYGLGNITGNYDYGREDLFQISFTGLGVWELLYSSKTMMRSVNGIPELPKPRLSRQTFIESCRTTFPELGESRLQDLYSLAEECTKQRHGTMLVVTSGAESEVKRLATQCIPIKPTRLTDNLTLNLTSIDGAVLIDNNLKCHAIGVILDGLATTKGDPSRGARYNSAVRYVETTKYNSIAVVISEDGYVDIIRK